MANIFKLTAGAVVTLTALYAGVGYLAVPSIVKSTLSEQVGQLLQKDVTVDSVSFNPWNWTLSLEGLRIEGQTANVPLVTLKELVVDLSSETLQHMAPVVDRLHVNGLHVDASLDDPSIRKLTIENDNSTAAKTDTPAKESAGGIPVFALYDIALKDSSLRVTDKARGLDQSITDINIDLPFVSTISRDKESSITPSLSFKINGTPVVAEGSTAPFGETLETRLNLKVSALDITQFARLVPALNSAALQLDSGKLSTDLYLAFRNPTGKENGKTLLSGTASLTGLKAVQKVGMKVEDLATVSALKVDLKEIDLLAREAHVNKVSVTNPSFNLIRTPRGIGPALPSSNEKVAATPGTGKDAAWQWSLAELDVTNGSLRWYDQTVRPRASLHISKFNASVKDLDSRESNKKAALHAEARLLDGSFKADGTVSAHDNLAAISLEAKSLNTAQLAPYIRDAAGIDLSGIVGFKVDGRLENGNVTASGRVNTANLNLHDGKSPLVKVASAGVALKSFDLNRRQVDVDSINLRKADIALVKNAQGLNLLSIGGPQEPAPAAEKKADSQKIGTPWQWSLGHFSVTESRVSFKDETAKPVAAVELTNIRADVKNLASAAKMPGTVSAAANLSDGKLSTKGTLLVSPLTVDLQTNVDRLSMAKLSPVLTAYTGIGAKSGQLDTAGRFSLKNDIVAWAGNINLNNFDIRNKSGGALMFWKNAAIRGLDIRTSDPLYLVVESAVIEQPGTKHTKAVREIAGLAGAFAALAGKDKTAAKIDQFEGKMDRNIVLENVRYVNGRFTANGITPESLAGVLLAKLSQSIDFGQAAKPADMSK